MDTNLFHTIVLINQYDRSAYGYNENHYHNLRNSTWRTVSQIRHRQVSSDADYLPSSLNFLFFRPISLWHIWHPNLYYYFSCKCKSKSKKQKAVLFSLNHLLSNYLGVTWPLIDMDLSPTLVNHGPHCGPHQFGESQLGSWATRFPTRPTINELINLI